MLFSKIFGQRRISPPLCVPHHLVPIGSRVGVEVEVEDCPRPPDLSPYWEIHHDGSLRNNGIEYVFANPLAGAEIVKAVRMFDSEMAAIHPDLSWRTSTHVHIDVRDLTIQQIKKFMLAYLLFEDLLIECQGKQREDSNFCPAVSYASYQLEVINGLIRSDPEVWPRAVFGEKYSAINLKAMLTHGTIEFRGGSAMTKAGTLLRQICRYLHIKRAAIESPSDEQLVPFIVRLNSEPLTRVFGSSVPSKILKTWNNRDPGFFLAMDAVCIKGSIKPVKRSSSRDEPEIDLGWQPTEPSQRVIERPRVRAELPPPAPITRGFLEASAELERQAILRSIEVAERRLRDGGA